MYIIVGLGNPGKDYEMTRHNVGFRVIDKLADEYNIDVREKKHKGLIGKGVIDGNKVVLVKPQTFMNLSGECVREVMDYYKEEPENVIVVYDDISLDVAKLRVRPKGSAGGHNGIKSLIAHLGTDVFPRVKFGVGDKPKGRDLADYVLGHFSKEENVEIEDRLKTACDAIVCIMNEDCAAAMNKYNAG